MEENDKPMDEFGWEEFLKKNDLMVDKYAALMQKYMDDPNCDEIIAREMGWNHMLEDDGIERPWLDEMNAAMERGDDVEEGDEWKVAAEIEDESEYEIPDFRKDPLYRLGFSFAVDFINWFRELPETIQDDPDLLEAMRNATIPGAKIAGAVSIDDEDKDQLGMRLATYKRGLVAANKTLTALSVVKEKNLINQKDIFPFIKRATELRNAMAVRVLEIRDRFNSK